MLILPRPLHSEATAWAVIQTNQNHIGTSDTRVIPTSIARNISLCIFVICWAISNASYVASVCASLTNSFGEFRFGIGKLLVGSEEPDNVTDSGAADDRVLKGRLPLRSRVDNCVDLLSFETEEVVAELAVSGPTTSLGVSSSSSNNGVPSSSSLSLPASSWMLHEASISCKWGISSRNGRMSEP